MYVFIPDLLKKKGMEQKNILRNILRFPMNYLKHLQKNVSIIGVDFAGVRRGKEHTPMDQYCADHGVCIIENLCNLCSVLKNGNAFIANIYPMNYAEMTGLPCRVVVDI